MVTVNSFNVVKKKMTDRDNMGNAFSITKADTSVTDTSKNQPQEIVCLNIGFFFQIQSWCHKPQKNLLNSNLYAGVPL